MNINFYGIIESHNVFGETVTKQQTKVLYLSLNLKQLDSLIQKNDDWDLYS